MKRALAFVFIGLLASCEEKKTVTAPEPVKAPSESPELEAAKRKIVHLERELSEAKDLQTRQAEVITGLRKQVAEYKGIADDAIAAGTQALEAQKTAATAYRAAITTQQAPPPASVASAVPTTPVTKLPWWQPPAPGATANTIKASAAKKWKDDYRMVEHEIGRQTEAYEKLKKLNLTYNHAVKDIIARAVEKWPGDYTMMLYEAERQIEALQNLQNR